MHDFDLTRRGLIASLGSVGIAASTAGCIHESRFADLKIEDVWMRITDTSKLRVSMKVYNEGEERVIPLARLKVEWDGKLIGMKKELMATSPGGPYVLEATFGPLKKNVPRSAYTASGTLPDHDWVTARDG